MSLLPVLTLLIIASIGLQSSPVNMPKSLDDSSLESADPDDAPLETELALESVRHDDTPAPIVEYRCLSLGRKCRHSKLPCCDIQKLKAGQILLTEGACFIFGEGRCVARVNIPNYNRYLRLAKEVNKSNYGRLRREYWKDVLSPFFYRASLRSL